MAFCCFKSSPNTGPSSRGVKGSIAKNRNELDLLAGQKAMGSESDLGISNMGIGMGLSFDDQLMEPRKQYYGKSLYNDTANGFQYR